VRIRKSVMYLRSIDLKLCKISIARYIDESQMVFPSGLFSFSRLFFLHVGELFYFFFFRIARLNLGGEAATYSVTSPLDHNYSVKCADFETARNTNLHFAFHST
jgi:hypothetical protein